MRGEPFAASQAGCGGYASGGGAAPSHCQRPVTWVGLAFYPQGVKLCRGFACNEHYRLLDVAYPIGGEDCPLRDEDARGELERRREHIRRVRRDHIPHVPVLPLETGAAARRRLQRARTEAAGHEGWWVAAAAP